MYMEKSPLTNLFPLVLALNITNDLLFEQHISMYDIKATKHIYPDVARLVFVKEKVKQKGTKKLSRRSTCKDRV